MRRHLSSLTIGLLVFLAACTEEGLPVSTAGQTASADAPVITGIDQKDLGNGFVGLTAKATDPKNRSLTFNWRVDNGQLSQATGRAVTWKVPTQAGDYTATLEVKNDTGQAATATQRFTVSQTGQVQAQGSLQVTASSSAGTIVNGRFVIPSPLGSQQPNPPVVGGVAPAPSAALPTPPLSQPVATPAPVTPVPTAGPAQPIAVGTATPPPAVLPASPFPSPSPATPEPEVPQRPPEFWIPYDSTKIPVQAGWLALHFPKTTRGWIAGGSAQVLLYDKTGATEPALVQRNVGITMGQINQIHFVSDNVGFIAGLSGAVMRTRDAGLTWQDIGPPPTVAVLSDIKAMVVGNEQIVTIADTLGNVYRNEGANGDDLTAVKASWALMPSKPNDRPGDVASNIVAGAGFPADPSLAYFVGDAVYRLDSDNPDPTKKWKRMMQLKAPETGDLGDGTATAVKVASPSEVWVGTSGGALYRLQNANADAITPLRLPADKYDNREDNGNGIFLPRVGGITALAVLDPTNGFVAHVGVYDTNDAAAQWRKLVMPGITFNAMQIDFVTENNKVGFRGWGVGGGGVIYQYKPGN